MNDLSPPLEIPEASEQALLSVHPDWDDQIERVAIYLYRDERGWHGSSDWYDQTEATRVAYVKRSRAVGHMFNFPGHTNIVRQWALLCPCDHNPETTQGPERECPIHGEMPYAIVRLADAVRRVEQADGPWFAPAIPVSPPTGEVRVRRARPDGPDTA